MWQHQYLEDNPDIRKNANLCGGTMVPVYVDVHYDGAYLQGLGEWDKLCYIATSVHQGFRSRV
jgi:hypothetical protein